jgi:hypothetical protein
MKRRFLAANGVSVDDTPLETSELIPFAPRTTRLAEIYAH